MPPKTASAQARVKNLGKRVLIIQTGTAPPEIRERMGDFAEWFRLGLGLIPDQIECVRVDNNEMLPAPENVAAAVITGSGAMVTQRLDWSERTAAWLVDAAAIGLPMLGVCYGHQLLAHAFGGRVEYNPLGREIGTVGIKMLPAAKDDVMFRSLPNRFNAQATHLQTVIEPPRGAVVLAQSAQDGCQAVRYAKQVWGVQFHPEFGVRQMRAYLHARAQAIMAEGLDASALIKSVRSCPQARFGLRRFAQLL